MRKKKTRRIKVKVLTSQFRSSVTTEALWSTISDPTPKSMVAFLESVKPNARIHSAST